MDRQQVLLGNEAIGLGLAEGGCRIACAYPGTPSTEVLPALERYQREFGLDGYVEWSIHEKAALEIAIAASWSGLPSAVAMKQVGLNVAADPLLSVAYTGVVGGLVLVVADDPGPHSSQTEQDTRLFALFARVPVLDPSSPTEAREMARYALDLSRRHRVPVILRPTTRVCHARQTVARGESPRFERPSVRFGKDRDRWAATPGYRKILHRELAAKLRRIEQEFEESRFHRATGPDGPLPLGILAGGAASGVARDLIEEWGLADRVGVLSIGTPYPLPARRVGEFVARSKAVLVLEEPGEAIELQIGNRDSRVLGRLDETVPDAGELTPEVVAEILSKVAAALGLSRSRPIADRELERRIASLAIPVRRPTLCPGCGHRSAFFAIRRAARQAIHVGDIGCTTLGTNLRAVDTVLDMGASISMAAGFDRAHRLAGVRRWVVATIGDSTFFHSGIPALANAVHTGARFTLVILDNGITAMTGFQPTPGSAELAGGGRGTPLSIARLVEACGVRFVRETDPFDIPRMEALLGEARAHSETPEGGVAVILASRPCTLHDPSKIRAAPARVEVAETCDGCRYCIAAFECPALVHDAAARRVEIDRRTCVDCGECVDACPKGAIVPVSGGAGVIPAPGCPS